MKLSTPIKKPEHLVPQALVRRISTAKGYPTKTTVNLVSSERTLPQQRKLLRWGILAAVCLLLFCKFAVIDRWGAVADLQAETEAVQTQLSQLQDENRDYDAVSAEYARYFSNPIPEDAAPTADCLKVLDLIQETLMPRAGIASVSFTETTVKVQLTGIDLNGASASLSQLHQNPLVGNVELYTANSETGAAPEEKSSVVMTITLITDTPTPTETEETEE